MMLYKKDSTEVLFTGVSFRIRGVANCCSAACMTGISLRGHRTPQALWVRAHEGNARWEIPQPRKCSSIRDWFDHHKVTAYAMPVHYLWMKVLEAIVIKSRNGDGQGYQDPRGDKYELWAKESYPTRTWFFTDSDKGINNRGVMGFMNWLQEMGTGEIGRCHISPWADGAHGGQCKGAVYAPNLPKCEALIKLVLRDLNDHAVEVSKERDVSITGLPIDDEVAKLW